MKQIRPTHIVAGLLLYFTYMFGSCFVIMLAEALLSKIINSFVALSYPVLTTIRIVIYSVGVPAVIGVASYHEGYREANVSVPETVISGVLALIPYVLFAMLFRFHGFVSGAVRFTAGLLHNGWQITETSLVEKTPYPLFLIVFLLYGLIYTGVISYCKYIGCNQRIMDRADLRKHETTEE